MTDDTTTGSSEPEREKAAQPTGADQRTENEDSGAATDAEPLTESPDGGLEGGDPGVEE